MKFRNIILTILLVLPLSMAAQDLRMKATNFGIRSDGVTMNTTSIQKAIDYLHEHGGGTLEFYVGRYLTGSIKLKSNVRIYLDEAAVLVGSKNPYDYVFKSENSALILAENAENIGITGKGVVEGAGKDLVDNINAQIQAGTMKEDIRFNIPTLISFKNCKNIEVKEIMMKKSAGPIQHYQTCSDLLIDGINANCAAAWNGDGMLIVNCKDAKVLNSYISSTGDGILLKSDNAVSENIEIGNNTIRSNTNGLNIAGDSRNIHLINNKVYNTCLSAINIVSTKGKTIKDILVDNLQAVNVGNGTFIQGIGELKDITIKNSHILITKKDADNENSYNATPCIITGQPTKFVENVTLQNVEITFPGGGDKRYAYAGTTPDGLNAIPELPEISADFSKLKEMPAWGFFIRHAKGIIFDNVVLKAEKKDYRPAIVLSDVSSNNITNITIEEANAKKKEQIIQRN